MSGRFDGDVGSLATVFSGIMEAKRTFCVCKYEDESARTDQAVLLRGDKGIDGAHALLHHLYRLQPNLSFTKNQIKAALKLAYDHVKAKQPSVRMSHTEYDDWLEAQQRRLRNCCRIASQGKIKSPGAAWFKALPWNAGVPLASFGSEAATSESGSQLPGTEPSQAVVHVGDASTYVEYGFLDECRLPYRRRAGEEKETGLPIKLPHERADDDEVVGEWPDGHTHVIPGVTFGQLRSFKPTARTGVYYEKEHASTLHRITIVQKVDRSLLLAINEQDRQILMVKLNLFGHIDDEKVRLQRGDPVLQAGLEFMATIADRYVRDEIKRRDLKDVRNSALLDKGIDQTRSTVKKRPVCADHHLNDLTRDEHIAARLAADDSETTHDSAAGAAASHDAEVRPLKRPSCAAPCDDERPDDELADATLRSSPPVSDSDVDGPPVHDALSSMCAALHA